VLRRARLLACVLLAALGPAGPAQDAGAPEELGKITRLDDPALLGVTDDDLASASTGLPFRPLWILMAYARDLEPGAADWAAAPELDQAAFERLVADGAAHRYQPFRIERARLLSLELEPAGENPARIERCAAGWLEHPSWAGPVRFLAPFTDLPGDAGDVVSARGFFFKHQAYAKEGAGAGVAPVFVLTDLELAFRQKRILTALGFAAAGSTAALVMLFLTRLARGPRWAALRDRLARRRRARRPQHDPAGPAKP